MAQVESWNKNATKLLAAFIGILGDLCWNKRGGRQPFASRHRIEYNLGIDAVFNARPTVGTPTASN